MKVKNTHLIKEVALMVILTILLSTLAVGIVISEENSEDIGKKTGEKKLVLVTVNSEKDIESLRSEKVKIVDRYGRYALIDASTESIIDLQGLGVSIDTLKARTKISVKDHKFDIINGEPGFDPDLMIEGYSPKEQGMYILHTLGPVNPEWRRVLEEEGVEILNYIPNYAYHVRMTPELKEEVEDLFFVDWIGLYHPAYKLDKKIHSKEILIFIGNSDTTEISIDKISKHMDLIKKIVKLPIGRYKYKVRGTISDPSKAEEIVKIQDVLWVTDYKQPKIMDEVSTQTIGGYFSKENPNSTNPYRGHGDYGSYANQIGYRGSGIGIQVGDTGLSDGNSGDAGHADFTGRVLGGTDLGSTVDGWHDEHGHGTHCSGLAAGDTYNGNGVTYAGWCDYYVGQGSAPEADLWMTQLFEGTSWDGPSTYLEISEDGVKNGNCYIASHSWGSASDSVYEDSDSEFDIAVRDADSTTSGDQPMVIFTSAGNGGPNEYTIGSPATGKNLISVGASMNHQPDASSYGCAIGSSNVDEIATFSSRGPAEDGRIKPDVVAPGAYDLSTHSSIVSGSNLAGLYSEDNRYEWCSGTSMSCPTAAGAGAVVAGYYESEYGTLPSPEMTKALMINTAQDMNDTDGNTGPIPNNDEGWGRVFIPTIVDPSSSWDLYDRPSQMQTGDVDSYDIYVNNYSKPLKITLAYTDKEASPGDNPTLKNDLWLKVTAPSNNVWYGNAFENGMSVKGMGNIRQQYDTNSDNNDDRNNVENVYIPADELERGKYTVEVEAFNVPEDGIPETGAVDQDYALVVYNSAKPESDGEVYLDRNEYTPEDNAVIYVLDADITGTSQLSVDIRSDTETSGESVTLYETSTSGLFQGDIDISTSDSFGVLQVSNGDTVTVDYYDSDTGGGSSSTKTDEAYIDGDAPSSPTGLQVDWWGTVNTTLFSDDVEGGDLGYTTGILGNPTTYDTWDIRTWSASSPTHSWDFGGGNISAGYRNYLAYLHSPEIDLSTDDSVATLELDQQYTFGEQNYSGGNVKISTDGGNTWELLYPKGGYPDFAVILNERGYVGGSNGWEKANFDLTPYIGESSVIIRWEVGVYAMLSKGYQGWQIDDIYTYSTEYTGTKDNNLTWTLSNDDGAGDDDVVKYNIYRSDSQSGPWDPSSFLKSVPPGNDLIIDRNKGESDGINWWYVVRAVDNVGNEDTNTNAVPEYWTDMTTMNIDLTAGGPSDGWNFVSFNLTVSDNSLTGILDDPSNGISGSYNKVMYYDANEDEWKTYVDGRSSYFNDLNTWNRNMGIWIHMTSGDTLTIEGAQQSTTSITLQPGWSMVGYPSSYPGNNGLPAEVSKIGYFDSSKQYNLVYANDPSNFSFTPKEGYWLYNGADYSVTWTVDY